MARGTVSGGVLTVASATAAGTEGSASGGGATGPAGWPSDRIDVSGLFSRRTPTSPCASEGSGSTPRSWARWS